MSRPANQDSEEAREPWATPMLRGIDLTADEIAQLRESDDPMALLFKMKPELKGRQGQRPTRSEMNQCETWAKPLPAKVEAWLSCLPFCCQPQATRHPSRSSFTRARR